MDATNQNYEALKLLWPEIYQRYLDVYFQEIMVNSLVERWSNFDLVSRTVIAITASGSAVSGWVIWQQPEYKLLWAFVAGIAAVLAIISSQVPIAEYIRKGSQADTEFQTLRISFEKLLLRMKTDLETDSDMVREEFFHLAQKFVDICEWSPRFPLVTDRFRDKKLKELKIQLVNRGLLAELETNNE